MQIVSVKLQMVFIIIYCLDEMFFEKLYIIINLLKFEDYFWVCYFIIIKIMLDLFSEEEI